MADVPSIMISWAHRDPGWDDVRAKRWSEEVLGLAIALRTLGFVTEVDLLHLHERDIDWSRWGPLQVRLQDVVLIAVSQGWRERWDGTNDPRVGAGAAAEADALLGIFNNDGQLAFREKVILVVLPSMRHKPVIPDRLTGVNRVELDDFSEESLSPLVHLLTESPLYDIPPLGVLPPLSLVPPPTLSDSAYHDLRVLDERIRTLRSAAAGLSDAERRGRRPTHERISLQIDLQLAGLLKERAKHLERSALGRNRRASGSARARARRPRVRRVIATFGLLACVAVGIAVGVMSALALDPRPHEQHRSLAHALTERDPSSLVSLPDPPGKLTLPRLHNRPQSHSVSGSSGATSQGAAASGVGLPATTVETSTSRQQPSSGKESTRSGQASNKRESGTKESSGGA